MPTGSCLCGEIRISYTGEPKFTVQLPRLAFKNPADISQAICHCKDDRKIGVPCFQVPKENFKIDSGVPKIWTKKSDFDRV